ncbi:copper radical oxidase [Hydnum rufescens UP504]|uniref:Copper radical oxidase n=1 Tax=Hydnum rufescens UP504 TaxID=1448309 RepID=A0A9P6DR52_9AGAM|nr:copper radical oxidase [Hydnum rufescens UP504]
MLPHLFTTWASVSLLSLPHLTRAVTPGGIDEVGNTLVSAMMMFLGSQDKVYILDKVEGNPTQINGHSAWAAEWDLASNTATPMDVITNPFCASGMHFPNGSFVTFGGNGAVGPGGNISNVVGPTGTGFYSSVYQDYDGENVVRILNPCHAGDPLTSCQWYDNSTTLMKRRWYSTAEPLANGTLVIVGGFVNGGYINRNYPNTDPAYEGGAAEPTYEFYPPLSGYTPQVMNFVVNTSGLNSYPHLFLMPSGKIFAQANYSTTLWDYDQNKEYPLPDTPGQIVRVYPASGAVAMLPLTPANNYTPTILFCGGTHIDDALWGNYSYPVANTWEIPASTDCQRITPEPTDGSSPEYVQDDNLPDSRTMGQFIALPDWDPPHHKWCIEWYCWLCYSDRPDYPNALRDEFGPWTGFDACDLTIRTRRKDPAGTLRACSLLPFHDFTIHQPSYFLIASVLIAGSNPNVDYNNNTVYSTEYRAEKFYPPYFSGTRPVPSGVPNTLTYGGNPFDLALENSSYSGDANTAATNTTVVLIRPGFTTHAMNMGQRILQLNNTYTVNDNGTIVLHVSQVPPNANLLTPGPALLFVVVSGIPSNGTMITVGTGDFGTQPLNAVSALPASVNASTSVHGSGSPSPSSSSNHSSTSTGVIVGAIAGGAVILIVLATLVPSKTVTHNPVLPGLPYKENPGRNSDAFIPLQQYNNSAWNVEESQSQVPSPSAYFDHEKGYGSPRPSVQSYDDYYDHPPPSQLTPYAGGRAS